MGNYLVKTLEKYPELSTISNEINSCFKLLLDCFQRGGKIFTCGNGGSAADSEHIVGELMKGFRLQRKLTEEQIMNIEKFFPKEASFLARNLQQAIPSISLVNSISLSTAFSNDINPEFIFAQQIFGLGNLGDVLIAISTSGNSKNVVNATKIAKTKGLDVIALTGKNGGAIGKYSDVIVRAPSEDVASIQEYHMPIYHCLCSMLEHELFV